MDRDSLLVEQPTAGQTGGRLRRVRAGLPRVPRPRSGEPPGAPTTPRWLRRYVRTLVAVDLAAGLTGGGCAYLVRFEGTGPHDPYALFSLCFPVLFVLAAAVTRCYETRFLGAGSEEFRRVFDGSIRLAAGLAITSFLFKLEVARGYVVVAFPVATLLSVAGRSAARRIVRRLRRQGRCLHRVVAVGTERAVAELARHLARDRSVSFRLVGACVQYAARDHIEGVPVLGSSASAADVARRTAADTVAVMAWSSLSQEDLRRLSWQLEGSGVDLLVAPRLADVAGPRIHIRPVAGLPLLHVEQPEFQGGRRLAKAVLDRFVAAAAIALGLPVMVAIALAVRLGDGGPALFRQVRCGTHGRRFTVYKFRTMRLDAEAQLDVLRARNDHGDGVLFKLHDDPRVTRVGRWLRRYSLDELPQLVNVLRGDMSLVGPRPPLPSEVARYHTDVHRRLLVKPGLTGIWQVSGRADLSWEESVRLDLHYVENWSLTSDLVILGKTLSVVLRGRGAY